MGEDAKANIRMEMKKEFRETTEKPKRVVNQNLDITSKNPRIKVCLKEKGTVLHTPPLY